MAENITNYRVYISVCKEELPENVAFFKDEQVAFGYVNKLKELYQKNPLWELKDCAASPITKVGTTTFVNKETGKEIYLIIDIEKII